MFCFRKNHLSTITLSTIGLLFCLIFAPQNAFALDIGSTNAANAISYLLPILTYYWGLITQLLNGFVHLMVAVFLLETAVNNSAAWIDVNSIFVQTGLTVTIGVANIFLIIAFIAIAIGYVFKVEGYNPRLIVKFFIAALLVNFAPLFVGMVNDIANVLLKGIITGNENIFTEVFLKDMLSSVAAKIIAMSGSLGAAAAFSQGYMLGTWKGLLVGGAIIAGFTTQIPLILAQIITLTIVSTIVTAHAVLFLTRIFMMQLLAVIAPLAVLSYAIPQAKKLFDLWKDWLLGWAFGGLLLLFLLVLGMTLLPTLSLSDAHVEGGMVAGIISFNMGWTFKWIALAIYMMAADAFCLVAIPALAKEFQQKMESAGKGFGPGLKMKQKIFGTKTKEGWIIRKQPTSTE